MSVLIKDIDKELYAKFKSAAALRGLRINDALCEAMKKWIKDEKPLSEKDKERIENNATYRRIIPNLLENNESKWVVISKGELIGLYPDRLTALNVIKEKNLRNRCNIVAPISRSTRKVTLGFGRRLS